MGDSSQPKRPPRAKRKKSVAVLARGERVQQTPFGTFMAVWNKKGQPRQRKCFGTLQEAKDWLEQRRTGGEAPPLTASQYASAQTALAILPRGVTLAEAARAFVAAAARSGDNPADASLRVLDALERFLAAKRLVLASVTVTLYAHTIRDFAERNGNPLLSEVSPAMVSSFAEGRSPASRNRVILALSSLCSWCVRHELLWRNPCDLVERAKVPEPPLGILTVEQADSILHGAAEREPRLVPYLALGLFTGIRPAELCRLDAAHIGSQYVILDANLTKTSRARTVAIRPNLRAWLDAFPPVSRVVTRTDLNHLPPLRRDLGLPWPHDCMRHSYATYAYELTHDAALVASEMGHRGTDVFFRHYRALANPGDGARFFAIVP